MKLQIEQYLLYDADKEMQCDASKIFFERKDKNCKFSFSDGCAIFYARFGKITKGEQIVFLEVVDTETGEMYTLNARYGMHKVCLKHKLYPPIIQKVFQ